jgi:hypothetical protein
MRRRNASSHGRGSISPSPIAPGTGRAARVVGAADETLGRGRLLLVHAGRPSFQRVGCQADVDGRSMRTDALEEMLVRDT